MTRISRTRNGITHSPVDAGRRDGRGRRHGRGPRPRRPQRRHEGVYPHAVYLRQSRRDRLRQGQRRLLRRRHRRRGRFGAGGAIYRGTLDRRVVKEFIPGAPGKEAAGLKVAHGKLYVAGGFHRRCLGLQHRDETAACVVRDGLGAGMLNDLVVTKNGDVFVTDSLVPRCGTSRRRRSRMAAAGRKSIPVGDPKSSTTSTDLQPQWHRGDQGRPVTHRRAVQHRQVVPHRSRRRCPW